MNRLATLLLLVVSFTYSMAEAQTLRPNLLYCGSSNATGNILYSGVGPFTESFSCSPDSNTQALLVSRSGSVSGQGAAWLSYLNAGGIIITEYSISDDVYNEIYGTSYPQGTQQGGCSNDAMPGVKINPTSAFWLAVPLAEVGTGCGMPLNAIVSGEATVTPLGAWTGGTDYSFAARAQGSGTLFLVEADWQDGAPAQSASQEFMGALIAGGQLAALDADIAVSIPSHTASVVAGDTSGGSNNVQYSVTVQNNGPGAASNVSVSISGALPTGVALGSTSATQGSYSGGTWSVGSLANGASATLTLNFAVAANAAVASPSFTITATGSADETDNNSSNDSASQSTTVTREYDLALAVTDLPDPVVAGSGADNLTYQFTLSRSGFSDASGVSVAITPSLPAGVTATGSSASVGSYSGGVWTIPDSAVEAADNGTVGTLDVVLTAISSAAVCTDCISVSGTVSGAANETDTAPGNDTASGTTSIVREYDLALAVTDSPDPVVAGSGADNLTYQFTLSRSGSSDASGVSVAVTPSLPADVTVTDSSASVGSFDGTTWTIPDTSVEAADNGTVGTLDVVLTAISSAAVCTDCISVSGTVSGAANETDTSPGNDTASDTTSIVREYDLALAVIDTPDPVLAGSGADNLTHQFTLSRSGPSDATGVSVAITPSLPTGASVTGSSASVGGFDGTTWTIPDTSVEAADNGTVGTLDIVLTVDHTAASCTDCISASATASYAANETDTNTANNIDISNPTSIENAADLTTTFATSIDFGDNATDTVIVTLSCNAGLPLEQSFEISEGSDVVFTMTNLPFLTPGILCKITAADAEGYALTAVANAGASADSCVYEAEYLAGNFERDASNTCAFLAVAGPTTITVNTLFENIPNDEIASDVDTDFETVITCQGASETAGSSFGEVEETDTTGTFTADWYADPDGGADCTVVLYPDSDAVEGDSCTFSFAVGDAEAGCDVVGTIFFEGVPTLSQYGLAIMALLLLGMGFVGFRRIV